MSSVIRCNTSWMLQLPAQNPPKVCWNSVWMALFQCSFSQCLQTILWLGDVPQKYKYNLKLLSAIFFNKFLFFTKLQPFKHYERCFLFHLKSSFRSEDIQIFVFPSSPLFLPISHCFRA